MEHQRKNRFVTASLYLLLVLLACTFLVGAVEKWNVSGDRIVDVSPSLVHFAEVSVDGIYTASVSITNRTKHPLWINGIRVSCGCIQAYSNQPTISPKQAATIKLTINTMSRSPFNGKMLVVISKEGKEGRFGVVIPIRMEMKPALLQSKFN